MDPTGQEKLELSLGAGLVFGGGGDVEISVGIDTENLELSGAFEGSFRTGFDAGVNLGGDISESSGAEARNNVSSEFGVDAKGSVGILTIKADLLKVKSNDGISTMTGLLAPNQSGKDLNASGQIPIKESISPKLGLRVGASVGMAGRVEGTTNILAQAVDKITNFLGTYILV